MLFVPAYLCLILSIDCLRNIYKFERITAVIMSRRGECVMRVSTCGEGEITLPFTPKSRAHAASGAMVVTP